MSADKRMPFATLGRLSLAQRIENMFSFLYAAEDGDACHFDKAFLDEVKAAALRGCAVSEIESTAPKFPTWADMLAAEGVRPEVLRFAVLMERKLKANDHKGTWEHCDLPYLIRRLKEEAVELERVVFGTDRNPEKVGGEAADVANFAMMLADNLEALPACHSALSARAEPDGYQEGYADGLGRAAREHDQAASRHREVHDHDSARMDEAWATTFRAQSKAERPK